MLAELKQVFAYRDMLKTTVQKDLRARYKGSILGFLWTFLNPLLQLAVYNFVFKFIMRVQVPGYDYTVFLFVGLVPWMSFSASILMSNNAFVGNANLLKKVYFPRIVLPMSVVVSNLLNMTFAFIVVLPVIWLAGAPISEAYVALPFIFLVQALLMFGIGLLVASLFVFFRDLEHLLGIFMMIWMYLTPILYDSSFIKSSWYNLFKLNPMVPVITGYREILLFHRFPDITSLLYVLAFGLFISTVGYVAYSTLQRRFGEEL